MYLHTTYEFVAVGTPIYELASSPNVCRKQLKLMYTYVCMIRYVHFNRLRCMQNRNGWFSDLGSSILISAVSQSRMMSHEQMCI